MKKVFVGAMAAGRARLSTRRREHKSAVVPLLVSGRDDAGLRAQAERLREYLLAQPELELADVAFSLAGRAQLSTRGAVVAEDRTGLLEGLAVLAGGAEDDAEAVEAALARGSARGGDTVFVFTGHGGQWSGMGAELLDNVPVCARSLRASADALSEFVGWPLEDVLRGVPGAPSLEREDVVEPALFAVMVALAAWWRSRGVRPSVVVGHSHGEVAAAHVAGGLSLRDAARVVALRSLAVAEELADRGGMVLLSRPADEVERLVARWDGRLSVAAINGPRAVVVSGEQGALEELLGLCDREGVWARRIAVAYGAHSAAVEGIRERLLRELAPIEPRVGEIPFYSTVTGAPLGTERLDAEHWYRGERERVLFEPAIRDLVRGGASTFIEVSPHPILTLAMRATVESIADAEVAIVDSLRRGEGGPKRLTIALAEAHTGGVAVDWDAHFAATGARPLELPPDIFEQGETDPKPAGSSLERRLADVPKSEWDTILLGLVREHTAKILGHASAEAVEPRRAFKELGFDSAAAVELQARLARATGLPLPATLAFDRPTAAAVAQFLRECVDGRGSEEDTLSVVRTRGGAGMHEPIVIVGMGCRYAGGVESPEELWRLAASERDAIGGLPADRGWDLEGLFDPDPDRAGRSYAQAGGFVDDVAGFDAAFFGIAPREAVAMDPQQRLLLEVAWEALEDAGIDPTALRGSQTGVFAGLSLQDYLSIQGAGLAETEGFRLTGSLGSVLSGRVAYSFGFEGPAVSVDTACSSSLVALHLACQAVRNGECTLALAGGATLMASPAMLIEFSRQRGLSRDGRCRPFAAGAEGVGWSEGVGLVVVERLSDAVRLGHRVLGVVRGSAINQDGASNGLTAPHGPSQQRVIRRALVDAGLAAGDVDAVEAHGTGTTLGDPIEAQALLATYGQGRQHGPLLLGSIKSNIGHAQAAAGVAGVIKMLKAFEHGLLPRTLHVDEPTPHVDWAAGEVELLRERRQWPAGERVRRAGVSSFGISGTNAHVILEEPPRGEVSPGAAVSGAAALGAAVSGAAALGAAVSGDRASLASGSADAGVWGCGVVPLLVSGRSVNGLSAQAERLRAFLAADPEVDPLDVAFSLAGRAELEDRGVVLGSGRGELLGGLGALQGGDGGGAVVRGIARGGRPVFVFPGQGAQWDGMAVGLLESSGVFRDALRACGEALEEWVDWRVEDVLRGVGGAPSLERVDVVQPVSFAVMVALAGLWRSFGVEPGVVVGHSQGEIAAACVAGGLSLRDAARVVVLRSRLLGRVLAGRGGMVSVALGVERVEERIAGSGGRLSVAAVNGPSTVVVSGEAGALDEFLGVCEGDGVWARRVAVDYASHSPAVEELRDGLLEALVGIEPVSCGVPFFSTAAGEFLDTASLDGEYWYRSLRERVRFGEATRTLAGDASAFIEVSPHPVLTGAVQETLEDLGIEERVGVLGSLLRGEGGAARFVHSLAEAWVWGAPVDWSVLFAGSGARRIDLPRYAFQRERYWLAPRAGVGDASGMGLGAADHPLLGAAVQVAGGEGWLFTGRLALDTHPWLADHAVLDTVLLPATAFLELALAAGRVIGCRGLQELTLQAPLVLSPGAAVQLQVSLGEPGDEGRCEIQIHSRPQLQTGEESQGTSGSWTQHAAGTLLVGDVADESPDAAGVRELAAQWPPAGAREIEVEALYDHLAETGFTYGPQFQGLQAAWQGDDGELYAEVALGEQATAQAAEYTIHPALLDAALHSSLPGWGGELRTSGMILPFALGGVSVYRDGVSSLRVRLTRAEGNARLTAFDEAGELVLSIGSLVFRPIDPNGLLGARGAGAGGSLHRLEWTELQLAERVDEAQRCALLGGLELAGVEGERHGGLDELVRAIESGSPAPDVIFAAASPGAGDLNAAQAARRAAGETLELLQAWLAAEALADSRLVLLTSGAVAVAPGEVPDPAVASVWGLLRSAQAEHPGRLVLLDGDPSVGAAHEQPGGGVEWTQLLAADEPQLALRGGAAYVPRLVAMDATRVLSAGASESRWHLGSERMDTFEDLALIASPRASAPLAASEVRVAVHAAGLNFHDVWVALGLGRERGETTIGLEGAGVVLEVGEGVTDLAPGDRVMGLIDDAFGPVAVTERSLLVPIPAGWSFVQAAAVPTVFMTAYYGLLDLAQLRAGESLLIHSAAGGVGMAAVQLARHLGAEVFATASPAKTQVLARLGLDSEHTASSRDLDFEQKFLEATGGRGVDVVLNSLAREFVDASLALLPRGGGRFLDMSKTDARSVRQIANRHAGVRYRQFDLYEAGPQRTQEILQELLALFERGVLTHLPVTTWDVRHGVEAFGFMREARHVGKIVLTIPQPVDPQHTVLITGGTGGLGAVVARHLASERGARHLLLASRSGPAADGADELVAELAELGCEAQAVACDVADRAQAAQLIAAIPAERPLSSVIHAAGVLDDGLIESLTAEQLERVMRPKVDAALNLHELTEGMDLAEFVLFSSVMGLLGGAGQGNYVAANAFLDALSQARVAGGLAGQSLAWGLWGQASGMTGGLGEADRARMARQGLAALTAPEGLALLDRAAAVGGAHLVAARVDMGSLRAQARVGVLPRLWSGLVRAPSRRRASAGGSLARRLAGVPEREWAGLVLEVVRIHAAAVLGQDSPAAIDPQRSLKDQGLDSLGAVELRTRLVGATGLQLPATLVFDRPSCEAIAELLRAEVEGAELTAKLARTTRVGRGAALEEPIAIVGMSCRYPGHARSAQELWELVAEGRDAISGFPVDRGWDLDAVYNPDPGHAGTSYTRMGGFVDGVGDFDADFFGISPREALAMDPQQRLLLEVAWEALEDAGIDPASLRGSQTGVFAGAGTQDYVAPREASVDGSDGFRLTGYLGSVLSGRVAYTFGFEGPAVSVDTACSSSLVALHLACQAVRNGECSLALAGGVTVMASPAMLIDFSRQRGLAADGRCKSFAAGADGTSFADGAGLVVVERLSDARRLGHRVLGVVRGSAINQDGASNGLTAPNGPSQERVIRRALVDAGLAVGDVDAVEAHGTGTTLGDPIEAQALLATYGQGREGGPLWLGSIKSNIGHSQAAAGVAGVIKMLKAFEHGRLPRTLHVDEPTSHVDWSMGAVELLTEAREWPRGERVRRAGVSSFGISGTNAHVVLEEPPQVEVAPPRVVEEPPVGEASSVDGCGVVPLVVSGRGVGGLRGQAERLREFLEGGAGAALEDVAFSLSGRAVFEDRGVVLGGDLDGVLEGLRDLAGDVAGDGFVRGVARAGKPVFVFPGQGAQWEGMAVGLLESSPVFGDALGVCGDVLEGLVGWRVEDVLRGVEGAPGLERVDVVQPVSFAVMVALAGLWRSFGVEPGVVVGHSQGEIAAACVAGGLSLRDAVRVVVLRSRLLGEVLAGRGGMVSVALGVEEVEERIAAWGGRLSVAAVNGPSTVVVSGEAGALDEFLGVCEGDGVWARRVAVDYASHSPAVEELREELLEALVGIEPVSCGVPFFSTAAGEFLDTALLDGEYWYRSLRERVRFGDAVGALAGDANAFIEVSPHPVLTGAIGQTLEQAGLEGRVGVLGSLQRDGGGLDRFVHSLAEAWVAGVPVDWSVLFAGSGARRVELPRYAFQRERYWLTPRAGSGDVTHAGLGVADHPLLGAAVQVAGGEGWLFTGRISLDTHPWLADHAVLDTVLLPGTAFLELALAAGRAAGCEAVEELMLQAPLVLQPGVPVQLQVVLSEPGDDDHHRVDIYSRVQAGTEPDDEAAPERAGGWTRHASGTLLADSGALDDVPGLTGQWPPAGAQEVDVEFLYDRMAEAGFSYGPAFQNVQAAWRADEAIYAEVALDDDAAAEAARFGIHPALLDAALHAGVQEWGQQLSSDGQVLPFSLGGVSLWREGASMLRVRLERGEGTAVSLAAFDETGAPVLSLGSLAFRAVERGMLERRTRSHDSLYRVEWVEVPLPPAADAQPQRLALLGDLSLAGVEGEPYADLPALIEALDAGAQAPDVVLTAAAVDGTDLAMAARSGTQRMIELLQAWLACPQLADAQLVLVTDGAVAVGETDTPDLAAAPLWGLWRSAQSEHPSCFAIVDRDSEAAGAAVSGGVGWPELLAAGESQLALRGGRAYAPRMVALESSETLVPPEQEEHWHLAAGGGGTLDDLALVANERARSPLGAGEVRVAVHAAGVNFRDVWVSLGIGQERGHTAIGTEGAGIVLEVGEGVEDLAPGDRVMGLMPNAFGPVTVAERDLVVGIPDGWSFAQAAAVPSVFLTAYYALVDLAEMQRGEALLIHAAAGGVGMAALQLARHLGAEVFATASPPKAGVLVELGIAPERIGSSRDLEFEQRFLNASEGRGVDVVLNSLTREFIDASLSLLPRGGRFLEMGKTDLRDPEQIARSHAGVRYRAFDAAEAGPARIQQMLRAIVELFEQGVLTHMPLTTWDVRRAPDAFRFMREARHVGKIVLTVPQRPDPEGTVLITGGTGVLGALVARHLATVHGARRLLLVSRSGPDADGAGELVAELGELGCEARTVACDVADRDRAGELIASIPDQHPLTSVIHAAGVLDDGMLASLTPEQVERVMRPKVDAALNLHELTEGLELSEFILFSSASGLFGGAAQGAYAAANTFLDALAHARRAQGLAGQSLAWGFWEQASGMTGGLGESGRARIQRLGILPFANGPELLDAARSAYDALVLPVRLDMAALRGQASAGTLPGVLGQLVRGTTRREQARVGSLARQLASVPEAEREATVLGLVRDHAASVLGHTSAHAIDEQLAFKDLGFDSLGAVELRNRLARATGLRLPSTLIFDYPNAAAVANYLLDKVTPEADAGRSASEEEQVRRVLASIPLVRLRESGLYEQLVQLAGSAESAPSVAEEEDHDAAIDEMDTETLVRMTFGTEETGGGA